MTSLRFGRGYTTMLRISLRFLTRGYWSSGTGLGGGLRSFYRFCPIRLRCTFACAS